MEKARKQSLILFLLRYALSCMVGLVAWVVLWWGLLLGCVYCGLLLPADAAEQAAGEAAQAMRAADAFLPGQVPTLCDYVWVDERGEILSTSLSGQVLADAQHYLATGLNQNGRYHCMAWLSDGGVVLQYRICTEYADPALRWLPKVEVLAFVFLVLGAVVVLVGLTSLSVRRLKRSLAPLAKAVEQLTARELDRPLPETSVQEFSEVVNAMTSLQTSLRDSLNRQWDLEHSRVLQMDALAHDLRTPLTVIDGNAQLLQETPLNADQAESVEAILTAAQRATEYVASLRAMAKVAKPGSPAARPPQCSAAQLSGGLRKAAQALCDLHGLALIWEGPAADAFVAVSEQELHRAVMNLVQNAVEESRPGQSVTVQCAAADAQLTFIVTDSGGGFSPQALRHGCDPCFTEHTARTAGGHTGFGLTFAAELAHRCGGQITLANTPGGHGCVTLALPCRAAAIPAAHTS